jgi:L-alanine-DL-glutamate epimerase-like enolase superfamily enzyme
LNPPESGFFQTLKTKRPVKISRTSYWLDRLELTRPYAIAYESIDAVDNIFVRIEAENGEFGMGVAAPAEEVTGESVQDCLKALCDHLEETLRGGDLRHFHSLLSKLEKEMGGQPAARAAVDMALHDLWAKHLGLPLADWLGRVHKRLPTSITIGIKGIGESLEEAEEYRRRGFCILKVKTGISLEEDIERLVRIRERVGSGFKIRVDANQGYSAAEFKRFMSETGDLDLEFVEQPLKARNLASMRRLPEGMRRASAADESLLHAGDAIACLARPRPFGIFNIKLMKCGGIREGMRIAEIARLSGIDLMWGCMDESVIGISAALHAALSSPATRYLDLDGSLDLARDPATGGFELEAGWLTVTDRPGLGVSPVA